MKRKITKLETIFLTINLRLKKTVWSGFKNENSRQSYWNWHIKTRLIEKILTRVWKITKISNLWKWTINREIANCK